MAEDIGLETVSSLVQTEKTDIRYVISYFGQSQYSWLTVHEKSKN